MLYAETDFTSVPTLLAAFAKQYKTEHFHIHGGSHHNSAEDTLFSVFKDDTNQLHQGARKAIKGGILGLVSGVFYYMKFSGKENQFQHTRNILGKLNASKKYPSFVAYGALAGLSWWIIHDMFLCPHGRQSSWERYVLAHAFQGGLMLGTLYHPSSFGFGMIAGAAFGMVRNALGVTKLPKNWMVYMPNFDQNKRRNKLWDDEEYELSLRQVLHTPRVFHPI